MLDGVCKLCLTEQELQESHYVPAALYPDRVKLEFVSPQGIAPVEKEMTAPLLCRGCEGKFGIGESEVLRHIAAKIVKKRFPLKDQMEAAIPQESHPDITMYRGPELGLDLDKFAYFMLSLAWRGAVHSWEKQEGGSTKLLQLGAYEEPVRKSLYGSGPFPDDTAVI